jgi:KipI family sensor histidine kinase inhibitor
MDLRPASDHSLLVTFGTAISIEAHRHVARMTRALAGGTGIRNVHPGYASVLVSFDPLEIEARALEARIREAAGAAEEQAPAATRLVEIPVQYGGEAGPDLEDVARLHGLSVEEVVAIHSGAEYLVYFLGFSPGFPYLGGMPEAIATPRLARPRRMVPAGSVAIGGSQTGVYPVASPGGWRLIGRTPLELFRADRNPPTLLEMGDRVRFVPS